MAVIKLPSNAPKPASVRCRSPCQSPIRHGELSEPHFEGQASKICDLDPAITITDHLGEARRQPSFAEFGLNRRKNRADSQGEHTEHQRERAQHDGHDKP
jgi:hypothetical protein